MQKLLNVMIFLGCFTLGLFIFSAYGFEKPPKPGPNFVWVEPVKNKDGTTMPGHWKKMVPPRPGAVWLPGHYGRGGKWIPGHWK